jgi:hypothetical protein
LKIEELSYRPKVLAETNSGEALQNPADAPWKIAVAIRNFAHEQETVADESEINNSRLSREIAAHQVVC